MRRGHLRSFLRFAAAGLCFAASSCRPFAQEVAPVSSTPEPAAQDAALATFTLHGTVVNKLTNQPIPRALMQCGDQAVLTDGDGKFELILPSSGMQCSAKKPGYLDPNTQPQIRDTWQQGIVATPNTPEITVTLTPEAIITGRVTLPTSEPGEGFYVALFRRSLQDGRVMWSQAGGVASNSKGIYRFAELGPGTYYISTQVKLDVDAAGVLTEGGSGHGFPPTFSGSGPEFTNSSPFVLTTGQHLQTDLSPAREAFHLVTIPVTNPVAGEAVQPEILDRSNHQASFPVTYDTQHQVIRAGLPNGGFTVRARVFGKAERQGTVSFIVAEKPLLAPSLTLLPMANIPVVLRRDFPDTAPPSESSGSDVQGSGNLQTRIVAQAAPDEATPEGQMVIRPQLSMYLSAVDGSGSQGSLQPAPGATDESLQLTGVAPGRFWVQGQGLDSYIASITSEGVDLAREPLVVTPGGAGAPIEVTLRKDFGTLKIQLAPSQDPSSPGPSAAFVYVIPQFDFLGPISQLILARRDPNQQEDSGPTAGPPSAGILPSLAPGSYRVYTFAAPHDLEYRNSEAMQPYAAQSQTVTVAAHDTTSIEVQLPSSSE